jgi:hypothetical protein
MQMSGVEIRAWLDKLEALIDLDHVQRTSDLQRRAFAFEQVDHIPTVIAYPVSFEEWPQFAFTEIYKDPSKMLLQELSGIYAGARIKDDRLYGIRISADAPINGGRRCWILTESKVSIHIRASSMISWTCMISASRPKLPSYSGRRRWMRLAENEFEQDSPGYYGQTPLMMRL